LSVTTLRDARIVEFVIPAQAGIHGFWTDENGSPPSRG
jgi:hypothetical protein